MKISSLGILGAVFLIAPPAVVGQTTSHADPPDISGAWRAQTPDGPKEVIVRPDSSASFGEEVVRWRLAPDTVYLAFGDEWVGYHVVRKGNTLTLSGGDLEEPIDLTWTGPPPPRPEDVPLPPAPPFKPGTS